MDLNSISSIDSKINWPQFFCNNSFSTCFDFFLQRMDFVLKMSLSIESHTKPDPPLISLGLNSLSGSCESSVLELASLQKASKKQQNNPLWTMKAWILTVEVAFIITAIRKKTSRLLRSVGFIRWRPIIIVIYSIIYRVHTRCKFVLAPSIIIGRKLSNSITLWKSTSATIFWLFFHLEKQIFNTFTLESGCSLYFILYCTPKMWSCVLSRK